MRTLIASLLIACAGLGAGSAVAFYRVSTSSLPPIPRDVLNGERSPEESRTVRKDAPRVEVSEEEHNFGSMDGNGTGKHDFVFKNIGVKPLTLARGDTSCKCTLSKLEKTELAPGESAKVTLEWRGTGISGKYRQTATIKTNDPNRPLVTLSIFGEITHAVLVKPHEIHFSRLSDEESVTAKTHVLAYLPKPLEIAMLKWSDEEIAEPFTAEIAPLTAEAVKEQDSEATAGYTVTVTVKPGLPLGTFRQKLLLKTNYDAVPQVEIPIGGMVDTDIAVIGRGWNSEQNVLRLGAIENTQTTRRKLLLIVRGPSRKEANFEATDVFPKEMKVELTKPKEINDGTAVQVEVELEIPEGCRPMNHLGSGDNQLGFITLKTGIEKTPEIKLHIQFAVLGG